MPQKVAEVETPEFETLKSQKSLVQIVQKFHWLSQKLAAMRTEEKEMHQKTQRMKFVGMLR